MRITISLFALFFCLAQSTFAQIITRDSLFDNDWKFCWEKVQGAEKPDFNDSNWRSLNLPHDWSIEDLPDSYKEQFKNEPGDSAKMHIISGPFDSQAIGSYCTAYTVGGTAWYRKHFKLPQSASGKVVIINFDGVYMNSDVWVNGNHVGNHPYGYTAFYYDISKYLNYGNADNIIAVEVKNEGINSRWYSGSGIYRHVQLSIVDKIHAAQWGTFVTTDYADSLKAGITIKTSIENEAGGNPDVKVTYTILNQAMQKVAEKSLSLRLANNAPTNTEISFEITGAELWSPDSPNMYKAVCEIIKNDTVADRMVTDFGIRTLRFNTEKGFFLNGRHLKLKGGALHANNGPLGAAAFNRAEERRIELMKAAGFNAVRCGHNPPSTAFLDACDKLGMLVIDEAFDVWEHGYYDNDYHIYFDEWWKKDITSMVMRDRNHPSVFTYSICNQVKNNFDSDVVKLGHEVAGFTRSLDPTRPVSANVAQYKGGWRNCKHEDWRNCDAFISALDICGYSYQSSQYEYDHQRLPNRLMFSSEIDPRSSFDNWMNAIDHDFVLGNFEWMAMDHFGEVQFGWGGFGVDPSKLYPWTVPYCGDMDLCGFRRPRSFYRDILFKNENKLSMFVYAPVPSFPGSNVSPWGWDDVKPSWTWPGYEGKNFTVAAYSACDSVQLILNSKVIGTKTTSRATEFIAKWQVPYEEGILKAVGYINGIKATECLLTTAAAAEEIHLKADRNIINADGQDLSYITVEVTDNKGVLNPHADNRINFSIEGEGKIIGTGNSNPLCVDSFQQPYRKAYEGKCLVIVQSTGNKGSITLTAGSNGLNSGKIVIKTK